MPKIMEALTGEAGLLQQRLKLTGDVPRIEWCAYRSCEHEASLLPALGGHALLELADVVGAQRLDGNRGKGDGAATPGCLWLNKLEFSIDALQSGAHSQPPCIEIHIGPAESKGFTGPRRSTSLG